MEDNFILRLSGGGEQGCLEGSNTLSKKGVFERVFEPLFYNILYMSVEYHILIEHSAQPFVENY
jgi:hypothetical protein